MLYQQYGVGLSPARHSLDESLLFGVGLRISKLTKIDDAQLGRAA
jgi:hypothetical protein